jgi:glycosyltransferase involved in cell wall biosynthesis
MTSPASVASDTSGDAGRTEPAIDATLLAVEPQPISVHPLAHRLAADHDPVPLGPLVLLGRKTVVRPSRRVVFVTTPNLDPWAGAEELWSRAALDLLGQGFPVSASVLEHSPLHPRMRDLRTRGVDLWLRPDWYPLHRHPLSRFRARQIGHTAFAVGRLLAARPPGLVVLSHGGPIPPLELLELCVAKNRPFVTIGHLNHEGTWYPDEQAERLRAVLRAASRCFFVSRANLRLAEKQLGSELTNAEVVWNPVNVRYDASPPWPTVGNDGEWRFACVARLFPAGKGQDLLFEALAGPLWASRPWRLFVYGQGDMRGTLERLAGKLGLSDRIVFAGFKAPEEIWAENHVLVMPSRYEGLPLAMVEAMLCGRPVVATNVAGHAEIIEDGVSGFLADAPTASNISAALERFWERRNEAAEIGKAGSLRIRQLFPVDPVRIFSDKLKELVESSAIG